MPSSKDLLTTQEFAKKAGVSTSTVSKWLRTEKIEGQKKGRKWVISESELSKVSASSDSTKAVAAPKKAPAATQTAKSKSGSGSYTIKEFSDITYLTEYGVAKWLREGRLVPATDGSDEPRVDASNLERPSVKRLVR